MMSDSKKRPSGASLPERKRGTGTVVGATLASRLLGFVRDLVIAALLGTGPAADAFIAALRLPNLLRRLFAEGTLAMAVVPVLADVRFRKGDAAETVFFRSGLVWIAGFSVLLVVLGWILAPLIMWILAPGFYAYPETMDQAVLLQRWLLPYMGCVLLTAYGMGGLNARGHFAVPAWAPAILNICILLSVVVLMRQGIAPQWTLVAGFWLGGTVQLLLHGIALGRMGFPFHGPVFAGDPDLRRIRKGVLPAIWSASVFQVNVLLGTGLASLLVPGSVSALYYADRLMQFPIGVVAVSISITSVSAWADEAKRDRLPQEIVDGLNCIGVLLVPATVGLILLRIPIAEICFQRGAFDARASLNTATAILFYAIGLWAYGISRLLVAGLASMGGLRAATRSGSLAVVANLVLGLVFMRWLSHGGVALATSVAAFINAGLLAMAIDRRVPGLLWKQVLLCHLKAIAGTLMMGIVVWFANRYTIVLLGSASGGRAAAGSLVLTIGAGVMVYGAFVRLILPGEFNLILRRNAKSRGRRTTKKGIP